MNVSSEEDMSSQLSMTVPDHDSQHESSSLSILSWMSILGAVALLAFLIQHSLGGAEHAPAAGEHHGIPEGYQPPPLWACIPFAGLLLCIAILPLIQATEHWWENNKNRLAVGMVFAAFSILYYLLIHPKTVNHVTGQVYTGIDSVIHVLEHAILAEYIPFIVLLFSLYVISGGISLKGDLAAHPRTNTTFLAVGALMASFIGTTGASMLLIRPLLQTNSERKHVVHTVIFFIFLVSNIGGCLLPIGDPPLFLGYLKGVPFLWTFGLTLPWAATCLLLLAVYFVWDTIAYKKETVRDIRRDETQTTRLKLSGKVNFFWLIGVVLCVALIDPSKEFFGLFTPFPFMRELLMIVCVVMSLKTTPSKIREDNKFNYTAILEVAALFIGIFICMQIPIEILSFKGPELGLTKPWQYFWATGGLSAFLDNAPTYVVFFTTAESLTHEAGSGVLTLAGGEFIRQNLLVGISLGAVFMGAMSYIGNGPNFMVKSIAEQSGIKMPSFFGYMLYSCLILLPLFVLVTFLFV